MGPDLSARATGIRELMDEPDADRRMLQRTYARFALVNGIVSPWRGGYRRDIRPRARRGAVRILDVGSGGADLTRALARRMRRDGLAAEITALDADARANAWASARDGGLGIRYVHGVTADLVRAGDEYDVVLSNHLLHHLTAGELRALLADAQRLVRPGGVAVHHDIARSRAAYLLFAAVTLPLAPTVLAGSFIRPDGLTSIRRSYTADELAAAVPPAWTVRRRAPMRLELRWEAPDAGS
ncbi:methyltransferase domain-containing protein [Microbacterium sp. EF45047]|uniref:methyltransferase domain-containing protein n=1 Tax=Microbacterium sp. EF45047 TaxID=2809708 RepID=UPI00234B602C|nr:methyltransferase domain-containing protein [Microbacterium sp. EF45047]WCM54947.1 methyltransferase domain-containing protein [Microbacterium sp. EF45047]